MSENKEKSKTNKSKNVNTNYNIHQSKNPSKEKTKVVKPDRSSNKTNPSHRCRTNRHNVNCNNRSGTDNKVIIISNRISSSQVKLSNYNSTSHKTAIIVIIIIYNIEFSCLCS